MTNHAWSVIDRCTGRAFAARGLAILIGLLFFVALAPAQDFRSPVILAPYALDFGRVLLGKTSSSQVVTLFNNGIAPQEIAAVSVGGDFSETDNCPKAPAVLAVRTNCEIDVTYKPSALAQQTGTLTVTDNTSHTQLTVKLSGTGTPDKTTISISPASLNFQAQPTGLNSPPQTVTVANTGKEPLSISNVEVNGDFMALPESTCSRMTSSLAPGASCTVQVVFGPLGTGTRSGQLVISDTTEDSPQKVPLQGTGK